LLVNTLENFQGTHLLGASHGHLSDIVIFLFCLMSKWLPAHIFDRSCIMQVAVKWWMSY